MKAREALKVKKAWFNCIVEIQNLNSMTKESFELVITVLQSALRCKRDRLI